MLHALAFIRFFFSVLPLFHLVLLVLSGLDGCDSTGRPQVLLFVLLIAVWVFGVGSSYSLAHWLSCSDLLPNMLTNLTYIYTQSWRCSSSAYLSPAFCRAARS